MNTQCNVATSECFIDNASPNTREADTPSLLKRVLSIYTTIRQHRIDRLAFSHLLSLDDNLLRDIGVTRADVEWANRLPLTSNAAHELEKLKRRAKHSY